MKLHLFGDSILRGAVTDISGARAASLDSIRTPAALINLLAGRDIAQLSGLTKFPDEVHETIAEIERLFAAGEIRSGDAVVMLDVGPHAMDTARHEADWLSLRKAVVGRHRVRLLMCGGFDNGARGLRQQMHEAPLDGRSPNDAVRAAAKRFGLYRGRTSFLELAGQLRRADRSLGRWKRTLYHSDEVHLTFWGQFCLCLLILKGLNIEAAGFDAAVDEIVANRRHLAAGTELSALKLIRACVAGVGLEFPSLDARMAATREDPAKTPPPSEAEAASAPLLDEAARRLEAGEAAEALELFGKAAEADPQSLRAWQGIARAAYAAGRFDEAARAAREVLSRDPHQGKFYGLMAEALQKAPSPDLVAWLDAHAEQHAPPRVGTALAELHLSLGDDKRARIWRHRSANRRRAAVQQAR